MYKVLIGGRAEKDLDSLELPLKNRIIEQLLALKHNPRPQGAKKLAASKVGWRLRIGDWRVLYEIDDKDKEVRIYRIKHRSRAY